MEKGQNIYYVRVLPNTQSGEILELKVMSVNEKLVTAVDITTKKTMLLSVTDLNIFNDMIDAKQKYDSYVESGIIKNKIKKRRTHSCS